MFSYLFSRKNEKEEVAVKQMEQLLTENGVLKKQMEELIKTHEEEKEKLTKEVIRHKQDAKVYRELMYTRVCKCGESKCQDIKLE